MDKQQARQSLTELFTQPFDRERYQLFLRNLLNQYEPRNGHYTGNLIPDAFKQHIKQYWRIGKYVDPDGHELDLLIVEVKSLNKLERARSALRNFAVNRLKQFEKEASLIAFYAEDDRGADWRFSFVKIEHEAYQDDKGKIKLKQELTPAKRYSYLVGAHENSHTASKQLLPLLEMDYADPRIEEIEAAFGIEKVTDEFFDQYKALFQKLAEHLRRQASFNYEGEEARDQRVSRFAKKLLGQIVFLYFLQKKGWLGVSKNQPWGTGSKRFMRERYDQAIKTDGNYHRDFLQYLFYEALADERKAQPDPGYYARFDCRVPFLNGGLFEADYDWHNEPIDLPNTLFHNDEKNKNGDVGTGILDVFGRYNFTIKEDEPLEKEVAVDPEMLGKVFENMLEVTERKSKGAFYTPREIVHYMCQESLIHYLDNRLNRYATLELAQPQGDIFGDPGVQERQGTEHIKVPRTDIETLIRKGHLALENDTRVMSKGKETDTYKFQLPESVRQYAEAIDAALADIKVCDPAIGSGAFPVGMLHEIVNARMALAPHSGNQESAYELKRHAIGESLYGVDIDASAIDIARLRLWLSLIVDEEDYSQIAALPNLDYKIVQGNALIGIDVDLFNHEMFNEIEKKKNEFFSATNHDRKSDLATRINELIRDMMHGQECFDFKVYFSEVWHKKNGFDVVIGNPPYFNIDTFGANSSVQAYLKKNYFVYMDKSDIIFYFFEKSAKISSGVISLITSNAYFASTKAKRLRKFLVDNNLIRKVVNFEKYMVFKEASITTAITFLYPSTDRPRYLNLAHNNYIKDDLNSLLLDDKNYVIAEDWSDEAFVLADKHLKKINEAIDFGKPKLSTIYKVGSGMQTGCNSVFVNPPSDIPKQFIRKRMTGEMIEKYVATEPKEFILYIENIDSFDRLHESVKKYLLANQELLKNRADKKRRSTAKWWNFTFPMHEKYYNKQKIWCSYRSIANAFCLDDGAEYIGLTNTTVIFDVNTKTNFKYLLALLNSETLSYRYSFIGKRTGNGLLEYFENGVGKLPIIEAARGIQLSVAAIVDYVMKLKMTNLQLATLYFEQLIDGLVYELYFPDEIKAANKEILPHLGDLTPITDAMTDEEKLAVIQREFDRLYDPHHPVRNRLETLDSVEVVRTIRGALKR